MDLGTAEPAAPVGLGTVDGRAPPELGELQASVAHLPLAERVAAISEPWLGSPYSVGPLGELSGVDPDPQIRYDTFDCLTFVEEVFALALAPDLLSAQEIRMALRYRDGRTATYENRRHFMLAEWIPGVVADGWFTDITADFEGAVEVRREVTPASWAGWWGRADLPLTDARLPVGPQRFWYLPLDDALAQLDDIPDGTAVFFLRQPVDHIPIGVTHVGVVVPSEQGTVMRHASKLRSALHDEPLDGYLEHQRAYTKWPLVGVILLAPQEYGPRAIPPKNDGSAPTAE